MARKNQTKLKPKPNVNTVNKLGQGMAPKK